ncbi:DUF4145 domain-containing protein [Microcoleus sp. FACHB-831]|uniref:DUF4145 domain-containing protein n=1 Tax=Microcoleus sp. FACHB-831 TaxID=2692827 RepID=UPI0016823927|nr:DUF4145 domain-containing protein [Microcoleus sp. FACHB-831]MBD1920516.1 DUF4145 domain-containing protein [Microcoleus sp. FACHB-831]
MYIDFNKYNYSLIDGSQRKVYIERDKAAYRDIIKEWFDNNLDEIIERKWLIEDILYLASVSDFIKLLKEAENLFEFGFYTGCIALTGISAEDFTKFLATNLGREKLVTESQYRRINTLKNEGLITETIHGSLDVIRKIRNDCLHYNQDFKQKDNNELKSDAIQVLNEFKKIVSDLIGELPPTPEMTFDRFLKVVDEATKQSVSENYESVKNSEDVNLKLRNASSILLGMPTAFHPNTKIVVFSGFYTVLEVDLDIEPPEITLEDVSNSLQVNVDLEEEDKRLLEKEGIKEGDIVQARIRSEVSKLGQTATWKFLNLRKM